MGAHGVGLVRGMANVVAMPLPLPNALSMDALAAQPLSAPLVATGEDRQEDGRSVQIARAFFEAATRLSEDNEDILPQVPLLWEVIFWEGLYGSGATAGGFARPQIISVLSFFRTFPRILAR